MRVEKIFVNHHDDVTMTAYLLDNSEELSNISKRPAVLIFPGGGYFATSDREAEPIAMAYTAEGYNAFVLRYSVGKEFTFTKALSDAESALKSIREGTEKWNVDEHKIAVVGFSAGGHLAAALGTITDHRPNGIILGYPVILSDLKLAFPIPTLEKEVDASTPPTFLFSSYEDEVVPIKHSLSFIQALNEEEIPFESHIFQKGAHGLSLGKSFTSSGMASFVDYDFSQWFQLSISWLHKLFGDFVADKESFIPEAQDVKQYSIDVQIGSLMQHPDCCHLMIDYIPALADEDSIKEANVYSINLVNQHLSQPLTKEQLFELNKKLKAIPFSKEHHKIFN